MSYEPLFDYLKQSSCAAAAAENAARILKENGFEELPLAEIWKPENGGRYFTKTSTNSLIAFTVPKNGLGRLPENVPPFRMIAAHLDSPCLRIKPNAKMLKAGLYLLNIEVYGGPIFSTWMDRPLSLAGKVTLKSENPFAPTVKTVDLKKPVLTIPNLAIHFNRDVNKGVELNPQRDLLPVGALAEDLDGDPLMTALSEALAVKKEEILDYDLMTYCVGEPMLCGFNDEFISAPRLDDLVMAHSALTALLNAPYSDSVNVLALWDNEEVGSGTSGGADSAMFASVLEKIEWGLGRNRELYLADVPKSFVLSADVAHATHPAHPEKTDSVLTVVPGKGPVIKLSARQGYITRSEDYSVFETICEKAGVPVQKNANRADVRGGGTIGPDISRWVLCRGMDMGIALLAMHSARELMAAQDYDYTVQAFTAYYGA